MELWGYSLNKIYSETGAPDSPQTPNPVFFRMAPSFCSLAQSGSFCNFSNVSEGLGFARELRDSAGMDWFCHSECLLKSTKKFYILLHGAWPSSIRLLFLKYFSRKDLPSDILFSLFLELSWWFQVFLMNLTCFHWAQILSIFLLIYWIRIYEFNIFNIFEFVSLFISNTYDSITWCWGGGQRQVGGITIPDVEMVVRCRRNFPGVLVHPFLD